MSEPYWSALAGGIVDYAGPWAAGTTYAPGAVVSYNGVSYLAVNPSTGVVPAGGISLDVPRVIARRTVDLSVVTATWTLVPWDAEDLDTDTIHDPTTNPARLTCKTPGLYQFNCLLGYAANVTGIRSLLIQKNSEGLPAAAGAGFYYGGFVESAPSTAITLTLVGSGAVLLAAGDYLAAVTYQNSGGALVIDKDDSYFEMHRVA